MLIQKTYSEELDHEFNYLLIYFKVSSVCNKLFIEICNENIDTNRVKSLGKACA